MTKFTAAGLQGPVLYCPACYRKLGVYKPAKGTPAAPKAAQKPCAKCPAGKKKRRGSTWIGKSMSVRTVSGGLPSLGKRSR